jgi:hypothetical protein
MHIVCVHYARGFFFKLNILYNILNDTMLHMQETVVSKIEVTPYRHRYKHFGGA